MTFDNDEKSDGGFYEEESDADSDTDFDLRSLLPASLEKLYLTGFSTNDEMILASKIQDSESELTPLLKKIYIGNNWETNELGECTTFLEHHDVPGIYTNPLTKYLEGQG